MVSIFFCVRKETGMKKHWYRRILIMVMVFTVSVGGSYYYIEKKQENIQQEVSAGTSGKKMVIPGGMAVGIYLETEGVMVLGTGEIEGSDGMMHEPAEHIVKAGDYIIEINHEKVDSKEELVKAVKELQSEDVELKLQRKDEYINVKTQAVACSSKEYKLGIWVRDNAQGLGTITYLDGESAFGALGHGIHDVDTNELLKISGGSLYLTSIKNIQKGNSGIPGGIEGIIVYNNYNVLGTIQKNTETGIYGTIDRINALFTEQTPVEVASIDEVKKGPATIRCAVEGKVKEYQIEITKVDRHPREVNKGLQVKVTDEELLKVTGGIVQGMSGSPIIQDGKLVGAVTHVLVNDPTRGYGIFIENMLEY